MKDDSAVYSCIVKELCNIFNDDIVPYKEPVLTLFFLSHYLRRSKNLLIEQNIIHWDTLILCFTKDRINEFDDHIVKLNNSCCNEALFSDFESLKLNERQFERLLFLLKSSEYHIDDKHTFFNVFEGLMKSFIEKTQRITGEYYTPSQISRFIAKMIHTSENAVSIYDPCCGNGGLLLEAAAEISQQKDKSIAIYGQCSSLTSFNLCTMNYMLRNAKINLGRFAQDALHKDLHPDLRCDIIMSNPPFNKRNWGRSELFRDKRWKYGVPPESNANFVWLQTIIHHMKDDGKAVVIMPNGALTSQRHNEAIIRKNIIEADLVECIIALPSHLFYGTNIYVSVWILAKNKGRSKEILFIDAEDMGSWVRSQQKTLDEKQCELLVSIYTDYLSNKLEKFGDSYAIASLDDVRNEQYILTPGRYIKHNAISYEKTKNQENMIKLIFEINKLLDANQELDIIIKSQLGEIELEP